MDFRIPESVHIENREPIAHGYTDPQISESVFIKTEPVTQRYMDLCIPESVHIENKESIAHGYMDLEIPERVFIKTEPVAQGSMDLHFPESIFIKADPVNQGSMDLRFPSSVPIKVEPTQDEGGSEKSVVEIEVPVIKNDCSPHSEGFLHTAGEKHLHLQTFWKTYYFSLEYVLPVFFEHFQLTIPSLGCSVPRIIKTK